MLNWLFPAALDRRLMPGSGFRGTTPFVIAAMTFSILIVATAGLALAGGARLVAEGIENRYVVQIPSGNSDLPRVLGALRGAPGLVSAAPVPEQEMRRTLERWLGTAGLSDDLPVPALVTLEITGDAAVPALQQRIRSAAPGASLIANDETLEPLLGSIRALQWLALALVALLASATSAAVVLAARGALDTHRAMIEVMHGIGATDEQVAQLFQRKIALDSMAGSLAGALAAAAVLALVASGSFAFAGQLVGSAALRPSDLLVLALLPVGIVILATWVARTAVLTALRASI